jgi:hypothetical protein
MNIHRTPKEDEVKYKLLGQEISKVKDNPNVSSLEFYIKGEIYLHLGF